MEVILIEEEEGLGGALNTQGQTSHKFSNNQHLPIEGRLHLVAEPSRKILWSLQ